MKFSRLWQPRQPLFWLMLAFNLLSSLGAWALRTLPLADAAMWLIALVSLANAVLGMWATWRLLHTPPSA
jgi:hypothetical protein